MWIRLRRWLNDIPIHDPIERRQAPLLQIMLIGCIIAASLALLNNQIVPNTIERRILGIATNALLIVCATIGLVLLRRSRFQLAVLISSVGMALTFGVFVIALGFRTTIPTLIIFAVPITLVGLLAGRRALLLIIGISYVSVLAAVILQRVAPMLTGFVPTQGDPTPRAVIVFILITSLLGFFFDRFGNTLSNALQRALAREQELEHSRAALETRTADLEREVVERRRVEAALRESEEHYRLIAEHTSDLISLFDLNNDWRRVYASPSHRNILGFDPAELIGSSLPDLVHPDDLSDVLKQIPQITATGTTQTTCRLRHADGSWRWIEVQASAIDRQGGRYIVAVGRDITERRQLQAQFLQAQRMESIGRLAGGVAHDFNNLLTAIMGNLELALDTLPDDHIVHGDLTEAQKAANRGAGLTRQLLAFARKQPIEPHVINLNDLIAEMDKLLRRLIGEDIELVTQPASNLAPIKADSGQLEQVIVNLAVNARDAMPNGGKLTIETRNVEIDHDYVQQHIGVASGIYVLLAISDTGAGMDAETLRQAFEPFFTTKPKGRGTGLGLATCYGIIKQHGGHIWPYSEPGHGSTFRIYLPLADEPTQARTMPQQSNALPGGTETVLLAEDELAVRSLAARVLRERGYTVLEASDGDEALRLAHEHSTAPIDLLLTDVVMPRVSGRVLVEQVSAIQPSIKVLYISGYADHAVVHHGRLDPGVDFLHKPFAPSTLARKVREVLDA
jgi:two-component system, cell cycle sensor histidine kinase and response regulator CckA